MVAVIVTSGLFIVVSMMRAMVGMVTIDTHTLSALDNTASTALHFNHACAHITTGMKIIY